MEGCVKDSEGRERRSEGGQGSTMEKRQARRRGKIKDMDTGRKRGESEEEWEKRKLKWLIFHRCYVWQNIF
jgi:hypothetical protein